MTTLPKSLLHGYASFKNSLNKTDKQHYKQLAREGQTPKIMIVACCDSRVSPETIFNTAPGEIFVVRNISNLIPPFEPDGQHHSTSAALEYGVRILKINHIVILGHENCGGITGVLNNTMNPIADSDFIGQWLDLLTPLSKELLADNSLNLSQKHTALEQLSLKQSLLNLRSFPWIKQLEEAKELSINAVWFAIEKSELWTWQEASKTFEKLVP